MLISHRKKFIYTKTSKTAGTSVECYFERWCMPEGTWRFSHAREETVTEAGIVGYRGPDDPKPRRWFNHMPAGAIRDSIGPDIFDGYFKFCVIRNPFDKLVSHFHFTTDAQALQANIDRHGRGYVRDAFGQYLQTLDGSMDRDTYTIDGGICIDFFIRFEQLDAGIEEVCTRLSIPFDASSVPRLKTSNRPRDYTLDDYYTPESINLVARAYDFELKEFGYGFPASSGA